MRPEVDYRQFRFHKLNTEQFQHLKLLIFWPIFGILFTYVERLQPSRHYYEVHCFLDDLIPFCEFFLIPYLVWFVALMGLILYTLLFDVKAFRKFMWFVMITYSVTMVIYFLFPTCQNLRPEEFARDNVFTQFLSWFYAFDTNTNVCPSIHVIGAVAVLFASWDAKGLSTTAWRAVITVTTVLICLSTVFLKQHSILDVIAALPLCAIGYRLVFARPAVPERSRPPKRKNQVENSL